MKIKKHLSFTRLRENLSKIFKTIPDIRQAGKVEISLHDALMSGFACMHFQDPSLLQFQQRLQEQQYRNNLQTMFAIEKIPKDTQMRSIIDSVDSEYLRPVFREVYMRLQRAKQLEQYQLLPNLYYFPIDGSQFYSSKDVHCEKCLIKQHKKESPTYSHQVLQGGIAHPNCKQVIPFMPEQIVNSDGSNKQDCEMNAAKRLVKCIRKEFPKLNLLVGGDALFSKQPIIELMLAKRLSYLFVAKPADHDYLFEAVSLSEEIERLEFTDDKGRHCLYEWVNGVPLNRREDALWINFLRCSITTVNEQGQEKITYQNSWVTDLEITPDTIKTLVSAGRCRWKSENEIFNVMKNHGYYMAHNYGHGKQHLAYNFYLLTLLAFLFHQVAELTDKLYRANRKKFSHKQNLWNTLRSYIQIIVFETWEQLLEFTLQPTAFKLTPQGRSP